MQEVDVQAAPLDMLGAILRPERWDRLQATAARGRDLLADRVVWNVNATAHGGGVAEMLQGLVAYGLGVGVDTRWLVLDGDPGFFAITKRIHNGCTAPGRAVEPDSGHRSTSTTHASCRTTWSRCSPASGPATSCCCTTRRPLDSSTVCMSWART